MILSRFNQRKSVYAALLITTVAYHTNVLPMHRQPSNITKAVVAITTAVAGVLGLYKLGHWLFSTPDSTAYERALANYRDIHDRYLAAYDNWNQIRHPQQVEPNRPSPIQQAPIEEEEERIYPEVPFFEPVGSALSAPLEEAAIEGQAEEAGIEDQGGPCCEPPSFASLHGLLGIHPSEDQLRIFAETHLQQPIGPYLRQLANNIEQLRKDRTELQKRVERLQKSSKEQDRELVAIINELIQQMADLEGSLETFRQELGVHENFFALHQLVTEIFLKYDPEFRLLAQAPDSAETQKHLHGIVLSAYPPLTKYVYIAYLQTLEANRQRLEHLVRTTGAYPRVHQAACHCLAHFARIRPMIEPYAQAEQKQREEERRREEELEIKRRKAWAEERRARAAEQEAAAKKRIADAQEQRVEDARRRQITDDAALAQQQQREEIEQARRTSNSIMQQAAAELEEAVRQARTRQGQREEDPNECPIQ